MDSVSEKKYNILKAFMDIAETGEDASALLQSNLKFFFDCCCDSNPAIVTLVVSLLLKLSQFPKCRQSLLAHGALSSLVRLESPRAASRAARIIIDVSLVGLSLCARRDRLPPPAHSSLLPSPIAGRYCGLTDVHSGSTNGS